MSEPLIPNVGEQLADDERLWRYVRLSSVVALTQGKVFIPSLQTLQYADPNEAMVCSVETHDYFKNLPSDGRKLLLEFATAGEKNFVNANPLADHTAIFAEIWLRELAKRRCAWCWYRGDIESMAQWHIYARDGLAIRSSPRRIRAAFHVINVDRAIIGSIRYNDEPSYGDKEMFLRPYLQKQKCYVHEKEVRVVFPRADTTTPGLKLLVDYRKLIDCVEISPLLERDEALELRQALDDLLNREKGSEIDDLKKISVSRSTARTRLPRSLADLFPSPENVSPTAFGSNSPAYLLSDDILRAYSAEEDESRPVL